MTTRPVRTQFAGAWRVASPRARRGFSIVEVTVAIALVAILGLGIATVFATVGETVTRGQRVSELTRFAARIERIMRGDFDAIARQDGFLVIHNEVANRGSDVPLNQAGDGSRPRRIDEIMFFARGDYTTLRAPLHPELRARADAARIYYGHGQRAISREAFDAESAVAGFSDDPYYTPQVDDLNTGEDYGSMDPRQLTGGGADPEASLGAPSTGALLNPNEFAADWTLLRHVTLLIEEPTGPQAMPAQAFGFQPRTDAADYQRFMDHSRQIAGHPAAMSVFSSINRLPEFDLGVNVFELPSFEASFPSVGLRNRGANGARWSAIDTGRPWRWVFPRFTSGVVDIATTSLEEIRAAVQSPVLVRRGSGAGEPEEFTVLPWGFQPLTSLSRETLFPAARPQSFGQWSGLAVPPRGASDTVQRAFDRVRSMRTSVDLDPDKDEGDPPDFFFTQVQQAWMIDALPSDPADRWSRIRYEPVPPIMFGEPNADRDETGAGEREARLTRALREADLEMLSASIFASRCTEFIVEFSFGITSAGAYDATGEVIWHGLPRSFPRPDGSEVPIATVTALVDQRIGGNESRYEDPPLAVNETDSIEVTVADRFSIPSPIRVPSPSGNPTDRRDDIALPLLSDAVAWKGNPTRGEYESGNATRAFWLFGYGDHGLPFPGEDITDRDNAGSGEVITPQGEWPWPTMIRITMSFVDPDDDTSETTYQAIFEIPRPDDV